MNRTYQFVFVVYRVQGVGVSGAALRDGTFLGGKTSISSNFCQHHKQEHQWEIEDGDQKQTARRLV
jgi:hypothetical protein